MTKPPSAIGPPPHDLFAEQADLPGTDAQLVASMQRVECVKRTGERVHYTGQMSFDHTTLVGPPTRLQGGLHGPARLLTVLDAIEAHDTETSFPSGYNLRIGRGIRLFEPVDFTAIYHPGPDWLLETRFDDTDRLTGTAFALPTSHPAFATDQLAPWRKVYTEANTGKPEELQILSIPHKISGPLFWAEFDVPALVEAMPGLGRFLLDDDHVGPAFLSYYLDNVAILSQATQLNNPMFTIQFAMAVRLMLPP